MFNVVCENGHGTTGFHEMVLPISNNT